MANLLNKAHQKAKPKTNKEPAPAPASEPEQPPIAFGEYARDQDWLDGFKQEPTYADAYEPVWSRQHIDKAPLQSPLRKEEQPPRLVREVDLTSPCKCGGERGYEVLLLDGERKRVDCAYCGRFMEFSQ